MIKQEIAHNISSTANNILTKTNRYAKFDEFNRDIVEFVSQTKMRNGYFLAPSLQNLQRRNYKQQIERAFSVIKNEFETEMSLNKISLRADDWPMKIPYYYIWTYFHCCNVVAGLARQTGISRDILMWYSADLNKRSEYPNHFMSFAVKRDDGDDYRFDFIDRKGLVYIGTRIRSLS